MNLYNWWDQPTVIHEFGHTLGFTHEQFNPLMSHRLSDFL